MSTSAAYGPWSGSRATCPERDELPACGYEQIEPRVEVEALVMLAVSLQAYRVSIREYAEGRPD